MNVKEILTMAAVAVVVIFILKKVKMDGKQVLS
jgi:hypothetical protein